MFALKNGEIKFKLGYMFADVYLYRYQIKITIFQTYLGIKKMGTKKPVATRFFGISTEVDILF